MRLILSLSLAVLVACAHQERVAPTPSAAVTQVAPTADATPAEALAAAYEAYFEESLALNPLEATFIGDARYNHRLANTLSEDYRQRRQGLNQRWLERVQAIGADGLDGQDLMSYEIFVRARRLDLEAAKFPDHLLPISQFGGFHSAFATLGAGTGAQPFATTQDYEAWLSRLSAFAPLFDQAIANMREGQRRGIVQPRALMEKALPQLASFLVDDAESSLYFQPIRNWPEGVPERDRDRLAAAYRRSISEQVIPAYRRLHDFIRDDYLASCRDSAGLGALPNGAAWYAYRVADTTSTDLTPPEIHALGLAEVARIHEAMRGVMRELGFEGDLKAFFAAVKDKPELYFDSEEEMLAAYRGFRASLDPLLPKQFDIAPKADYEIRAVEAYRAQSASSGSYMPPSQDGSRPGIFYANTYDLKARPRTAMEALFLHEAAPGHHFQIAIQQELTDLPRFRRFGGETAFAEGWGLYAESLGRELGVYRDPYMYFGALEAELWRSIRLVADTGLHHFGWSRQQVLDYMYANSGVTETRAVAETERFMAIPGQALAYKVGERRIRALRDRAEQSLGARFSAVDFHREVLRDGSVPLSVLESKIDRWIAARRP